MATAVASAGWGAGDGTANFLNSTPFTGGSRLKKNYSKNPSHIPPAIKYVVHYFDISRVFYGVP